MDGLTSGRGRMSSFNVPDGMSHFRTAGGFEMGEIQKNFAESPLMRYLGRASIRISSIIGATEKDVGNISR